MAELSVSPEAIPDRTLLDRVRGIVPVVRGLIGVVQRVGIVSVGAAILLWVILFAEAVWPPSLYTALAIFALGVLLMPAVGTFLAVLTLGEVLDLPTRLRALPGVVRETASEVESHLAESDAAEERSRRVRMMGFFGVLWRLRGIVEDTRGSWLSTLALARFARLASLPFAFSLVAAFALNFAVIAAALVAALLTILF